MKDVAGVKVGHPLGGPQRKVHDMAPAQLQARRMQQPVQRACVLHRVWQLSAGQPRRLPGPWRLENDEASAQLQPWRMQQPIQAGTV